MMTTSLPTPLNGVDRKALFDTIAAVKATPDLATFKFRVRNKWIDGGLNRSEISGFYGTGAEIDHAQTFELYNDEPPVLLSGDKAANPVEYVLHALAGCLTTTLVYHAAARGISVEAVTSRFEGDLDLQGFLGLTKAVRNGFSAIRVSFSIDGDLSDEQKRELIAIAQEFSPVFDIVSNGVPVGVSLWDPATAMAAE
jgi:uncharacterized OsmC-like protein